MWVKKVLPVLVTAIFTMVPEIMLANGTPYYFDTNGATAGFGSPSGTYAFNTSNWSSSTAGSIATGGWGQSRELNFGYTGTSGISGDIKRPGSRASPSVHR